MYKHPWCLLFWENSELSQDIHTYTCAHVHVVHEIIRPRDSQHNTMQLTKTVIFQRKNELPQAGLEPATFCVLCRCSTN